MPKKKFFEYNWEVCGTAPVLFHACVTVVPEEDLERTYGTYVWDDDRQQCVANTSNECLCFNADLDLDVCVSLDMYGRCSNRGLSDNSVSWRRAHPFYFPDIPADPRLEEEAGSWYGVLTACDNATPAADKLLAGCQANDPDEGGWTVYDGRGAVIKDCTLDKAVAWRGPVPFGGSPFDPYSMSQWRDFYHKQILWQGGLFTSSEYASGWGYNAYKDSSPLDFPFVAVSPSRWDGNNCVRDWVFAKFTLLLSKTIPGAHPMAPGPPIVPYRGHLPGTFADSVTYTVPSGCPGPFEAVRRVTVNGVLPEEQGMFWPEAQWIEVDRVVASNNSVTSIFYGHRPTDAWFTASQWEQETVSVSGVPITRPRGLNTVGTACREPLVDYGCPPHWEPDPDRPGYCRPEGLAPECAGDYELKYEYPGYPAGSPGFEVPVCIRSVERYIGAGRIFGWSRNKMGSLMLDGLRKYDDTLPHEKALMIAAVPGVHFRRASSVIDCWKVYKVSGKTQIEHVWTEDDGLTIKPVGAPGDRTRSKSQVQYLGTDPEWAAWIAARPATDYYAPTVKDYGEDIGGDYWTACYDPAGSRYVFAIFHEDAWWSVTATLGNASDNRSWEFGEPQKIQDTPDYTWCHLQVVAGKIEFGCYLENGDGVLLSCANLTADGGTWE